MCIAPSALSRIELERVAAPVHEVAGHRVGPRDARRQSGEDGTTKEAAADGRHSELGTRNSGQENA
jgi:hypothetical protein